MKPSFKSYVNLVSLTEEELDQLSEKQLDEIFGKFFGKSPEAKTKELLDKRAAVKAERDAALARLAKKKADYEEEKKAAAAARAEMQPNTNRTSARAMGRAADLDFAKS